MVWTRFVRFAEGVSTLLGGELCREGCGGHDQAHVPMPAVSGARFAMIQAAIMLSPKEAFFTVRPGLSNAATPVCRVWAKHSGLHFKHTV